jgi:hypothetical protein
LGVGVSIPSRFTIIDMKYPRLRYILVSLLLVLLLDVVFSFANTVINGPHPECNINHEVGSCDLVGASLNTAGWFIVPTLALWLIVLFAGHIYAWKKYGSKHKVRDSLILALIILPIVMLGISLIVAMGFQHN